MMTARYTTREFQLAFYLRFLPLCSVSGARVRAETKGYFESSCGFWCCTTCIVSSSARAISWADFSRIVCASFLSRSASRTSSDTRSVSGIRIQ